MKKGVFSLALLLAMSVSFVSCKKAEAEAVEVVEEAPAVEEVAPVEEAPAAEAPVDAAAPAAEAPAAQ